MKPEHKQRRPEKESIVAELTARLKNSEYVFLADYAGMNMGLTDELRRRLRKSKARCQVVKNRLLRQAAKAAGLSALDTRVTGSTAMVVGEGGDAVEVAKVLATFAKEKQKAAPKLGVLEGSALSADQVKALATMPPKQVLQAMLVGALAAPMTGLAGVLSQKLSSILYVLKAVEEKKAKATGAAA